MSDVNACARCGGPLPNEGALGGGCPRCMLELGFETTVGNRKLLDPGIAAERPVVIGRYRVLRLVGEGGMGAVYEAEQDHPRRTVALKIIKSGIASIELLRRFEQESQALGRLQHPGIAQIYEAGTVDTGFGLQPYFAMEFIRGRSPREYAEAKGLNTRERLKMMVKICDAVHHAHQRGLIHRDLKPGNILVDETGQPKILDFGVVRVTDSDARATLQTNMGQLIGTLAYMSPEQALADPLDIDTRSDVYSLGVVLYELLAGRLPYNISKKVHEAIQAIREEDPARLSTSSRTYRGDIETIVVRALEKERERRYASAAEMAADIQRYLNDEPIVARRPSASYQLQKFARRNMALVTGVGAVFVVLVAGVTVIAWYAARVTHERDRANENQREAIQAGVRETELRHLAENLRAQADVQTLVTQQALGAAKENLYFNNIALADREWTTSNIANSDRFLDEAPVALRNWEWGYLDRRNHMEEFVIPGNDASIFAMNLSSDGKRLRIVSADNTVTDLDLETGKVFSTASFGGSVSDVVLSSDGGVLYSSVTSRINGSSFTITDQFLDLVTGKGLFPSRNSTLQRPAALNHNGNRVVGAFPTTHVSPVQFILRWWDTRTGVELPSLGEYIGQISHLTFSPDDSRLTFVQDGSVRILNLETRQELMTFGGPQGTVTALSFSRNGEMVAAGILNEGVRLWRTLDGGLLWMAASGNVRAVAFGPDSHLIANALDDQTIRLLDGETGHEVAQLKGHSGAIRALGFTTSGNRLVSVGDDKLVHIWSVRRQIPPTTLNVGRIQDPVKVNPDGTMLLTSTENGMKSWTTTSGLLGFERAFAPGRIEMQFGNNDGRFVLLNKGTDRDDLGRIDRGDLLIIDARTGREKIAFHPQGNKEIGRLLGSDYWISSDGRQAALVSSISSPGEFSLSHSVVEIWETNTGKRISSFRVDNAMHGRASVQFSPTGNLLALGIVIKNDSDLIRGVEIYDTTTGRLVHKLNINNTGILVFSPVGNRLALVEPGRIITIWDAQTGMKLISSHAAGRTGTELVSIAFSPDGSRMVSVSSDSEVWLWDTKSGKEMISLPGSSGSYDVRDIKVIAEGIAEAYRLIPVEFRFGASWKERSISFSPDGQKIILTTIDPDSKCITVRIETWDGSPRQK